MKASFLDPRFKLLKMCESEKKEYIYAEIKKEMMAVQSENEISSDSSDGDAAEDEPHRKR
jgi:hypothetical protein